jgi:hypothetical protein
MDFYTDVTINADRKDRCAKRDGCSRKKHIFIILSVSFHVGLFILLFVGAVTRTSESQANVPELMQAVFLNAQQIKQLMPPSLPKNNETVPVAAQEKSSTTRKKIEQSDPVMSNKINENSVFDKNMAILDQMILDSKFQSVPVTKNILSPVTQDTLWPLKGLINKSTLAPDILDMRQPVTSNVITDENIGMFMDPLVVYQRKIAKQLQSAMRVSDDLYGQVCVIIINLSRDGRILSSDMIEGGLGLCEEAQRAALRAGKLPMPDDRRLYAHLSSLQITISPDRWEESQQKGI